jgi:hypothetical protein
MNKAVTRRLRYFYNEINGMRGGALPRTIEDNFKKIKHLKTDVVPYFGIQVPSNSHLTVDINQHPNGLSCCLVSVVYSRKDQRLFPVLSESTRLPELAMDIISDYLYSELRLQFKISFGPDYPFSQPTWSLVSVHSELGHDSNQYGGMTMKDYYAYLVDMHNNNYIRNVGQEVVSNWSPAITIDKDVLCFISRINHFDSI